MCDPDDSNWHEDGRKVIEEFFGSDAKMMSDKDDSIYGPGDQNWHENGRKAIEDSFEPNTEAASDVGPGQMSESEYGVEQPANGGVTKEPEGSAANANPRANHVRQQPGNSGANQNTLTVRFNLYYRDAETDQLVLDEPIYRSADFTIGTRDKGHFKACLKANLKKGFKDYTSRWADSANGSINVLDTYSGVSVTGYALEGVTEAILEKHADKVVGDLGGTITEWAF